MTEMRPLANAPECVREVETLLGLKTSPVAVTFQEKVPSGISRVPKEEMASCGYWRLAADGKTFYTEASDHVNCSIGAYTHGLELTPEITGNLTDVIQMMVGLEYLRPEEFRNIPKREDKFGVAIFSPAAEAPVEPDVVLLRANAKQVMLLLEAAQAAGFAGTAGAPGRPTCAMLPLAIQSQKTAASFACIGNRVYTNLPDEESYFAVPGKKLPDLVGKLRAIVHANQQLKEFHQARLPGGS